MDQQAKKVYEDMKNSFNSLVSEGDYLLDVASGRFDADMMQAVKEFSRYANEFIESSVRFNHFHTPEVKR